jgi:hypothetical protein
MDINSPRQPMQSAPLKMRHPRYPNFRADANAMRELLGLRQGQKLPPDGMPDTIIQGIRIRVYPLTPRRPGQRKRSAHRIYAYCPCHVWVPVGRLHQHKCK